MRLPILAGVLALCVSAGSALAQPQTFRSEPATSRSKHRHRACILGGWLLPRGHAGHERPGRLRIVSRERQVSAPVGCCRKCSHPARADCSTSLSIAPSRRPLYLFCYAEPASGGARTTMARARLAEGEPPRLEELKSIFQQDGPLSSGNHFGCRIVHMRTEISFLRLETITAHEMRRRA